LLAHPQVIKSLIEASFFLVHSQQLLDDKVLPLNLFLYLFIQHLVCVFRWILDRDDMATAEVEPEDLLRSWVCTGEEEVVYLMVDLVLSQAGFETADRLEGFEASAHLFG
jgi:hypothetical protein